MTTTEGPSYAPLVLGAANAAALLFAAQGVAAMIIADRMGASTRIGVAARVIPYAQIDTSPETFLSIVGWSSLLAVLITCLGVVRSVLRHRDEPLRTDGWSAGLLMALVLIGSHALRHLTADSQTTSGDLKPLVLALVLIVGTGLVVVTARPMRVWTAPSSTPLADGVEPAPAVSGLHDPRLPSGYERGTRRTAARSTRADRREVVHQ